MKLTVKDVNAILDEKVESFRCVPLSETEHDEVKSYNNGSDYIATKHWILRLVMKKKNDNVVCYAEPISTYLRVVDCLHDITNNCRQYRIEFFNGKELISSDFDSMILTAIGCRELLKFGCIYPENAVNHLLQYLTNSAHSAPIKYVHTNLGWHWKQSSPVFLSGKSITKATFQSEYVGRFDIAPKGSLDAWLDMVRNEVIGNIPLTFVMLLGFGSMLLGYLNHYLDLGCIVFNLSNTSSKGKTTAAMLAASVFSSPALDSGLITTLNSTQNALIEFVSQADSHTIVLDEAATGEKGSFRKLLYQLCSGRDRMRLNTDGQMKDTHSFNSIVICTSEFPIIDETAPNGIKARTFEIHDVLTKSAENADNIKQCVYANYGHAGIRFAEYIVEKIFDIIMADYRTSENVLHKWHIKKKLAKGELTDRVLSKLAVILLTGDYVNKCFDLDINICSLIDYALDIQQSVSTEIDISSKALDCIMQYVTRHSNRFIVGNNNFYHSSIEGTIRCKSRYKEITVLKTVIEEILADGGFESPRSIYKAWQEKKLIITEKDRPYKRIRLVSDLPVQPCFIFRIEE